MLTGVDFLENATFKFKFSTNAGDGSAESFDGALETSDIKIYKDTDGTTQRTSESGYTVITNFDNAGDTVIGIHEVTIDLSDDTDVDFFEPGHDYSIILDPSVELVDGNAVTHVLLDFGIENNGDISKHEGAAWFDSGATANTNTKLGTDGIPKRAVTTFAAAKTISDNLGTKRIKIKGTATLTQSLDGYILEAWISGRQFNGSPDTLNLNGSFTYSNLYVEGLSVNSDGTSTIADSNVWVNTRQLGPSDLGGTYENCSFGSDLYDVNVDTVINNGFAFKETNNTVNFEVNNANTVLVINNLAANISIQNLTLSNQAAFVSGSSIHTLLLSSSNNDGLIDISGIPETDDQTGAGCTVVLRFYKGEVSGIVDSNLLEILGTGLNESSAGRIEGNFEFFFDNDDNQTAKKVDDVGTAQLMAPKQFLATGQTIVQATIDSGGFADTNERLGTDFVISHDGTDLDVELLFNVGNLEKMVAFEVEAGLNTNGNRTATIELFDYIGTVFVIFKTIINSSGDIQSFFQSEIDPKFTDGNGDVRMRFKSVDLQSGNPINIAFIQTIANVNTGSIPSAIDNAIAVELVNSSLHGPGNHEGIFIITTKIDTVTSPTEFVLNDGPPNDITGTGFSVLLRDQNNRNIGGFANVVSYTVTGKILIIDAAIPGYTVDVGDGVRFFKSLVSTDLNDNDTNKKIIAQAIKEFDASTLTIDNGSILKELFDQVFGVNIIQVNGSPNADGNSFNFVLQAMAAMACGNFSLDTPVEGQTTFFKTNKIDPLFIVETTDVIRNRIL